MQAEWASADWEAAEPLALGELPEPAEEGRLLPHAAASRARATAAMTAAGVRTALVLSVIVVSSWRGPWPGLVVDRSGGPAAFRFIGCSAGWSERAAIPV